MVRYKYTKPACLWASALLRIDWRRESAWFSIVTTAAGILGFHWSKANSMLDVFVSKSVRIFVVFSAPGWHPSSFARLCFTSIKLARRWMMGHKSARRPKRVSTDAIAVRSAKSCVCGIKTVPDIGEEPNERAATTSKYRNACFFCKKPLFLESLVSPPIKIMFWKWFHTLSRKAPVGLRFTGLLSRIMDSAPRK